ncbi:MAG TPA: alpha/beta fold hydrolase [Vicinamibacterales bacterium]|nr:alpha/beta fold hydrolase [Vicinamibacterales bacterium]
MDWSAEFVPRRRLRNGHVMTIFTWARRRRFPRLPAPERRVFEVDARARVVGLCHWQADRTAHPGLLLLHGLEGSSDAHYMAGIADKAFAAGFNVVRLNQRNCGGTEHLSETLYHSGLTSDPIAVLREMRDREGIRSLAVAGYSLGGNLALKLAGELSEGGFSELHAVAAVSPTMDLERCVRALERPANVAYQWNFVRNLKARMRRKARLFPDRYSTEPLRRIRTVREFDEVYTAPHFGFRDASDYYYRASALRVVHAIRVPTLILTAADDPFVPSETFSDPAVTGNPRITVRVTSHGGHCAFLTAPGEDDDGYWAERTLVAFAVSHCARAQAGFPAEETAPLAGARSQP